MNVIFRLFLLVFVSLLGVSCAAGPGYRPGPRRGGPPPMGGLGYNQAGPQGQGGGQWSRSVRNYTHYRVRVGPDGEIHRTNMGTVNQDDPGLQRYAAENNIRVLKPGETEIISAGQVPAEIRQRIESLPRRGGDHGMVPQNQVRSGGYHQTQAPSCGGGCMPAQAGNYSSPPYPIPRYVNIPQRGMRSGILWR